MILAAMILLLAILGAVIWLRRRLGLSLVDSYHRVGLNILRFSGIAFAALAGLGLLVTLSDQIGLSHFGHPASSIPFEVLFALAGYRVWYGASARLRVGKSP
jgi:uncharacterized iron-regulated membrane protein